MKEVRRRFGPGVRDEVAGELMQSAFIEAMQERERPAGGSAAARAREDAAG
ncbi:MAG: hypothetical protein U5R48_06600 [Gammaproteobacteria bacterium]|nr:hypothetical protein [Gammaproteobacteria bacterium]